MAPALQTAFKKAQEEAMDLLQTAKDHPVFVTVIALGILVLLMPAIIELLGFGALGPIEGDNLVSHALFAC